MPERSAWSSLAWGRGGVSGAPERAGNGAAAGLEFRYLFSACRFKTERPPEQAGALSVLRLNNTIYRLPCFRI